MTNPILVELTRGPLPESLHRGAIAVSDGKGALRFALGDVERPIFPRSALKPVQAVPLIESGAAETFALSDEEIAHACASHSGEPMHTERVAAWQKRTAPVADPPADRIDRSMNRLQPQCDEQGEKLPLTTIARAHTGFMTFARQLARQSRVSTSDHPAQRAVSAR
jgi:L-asparaginase II